MNNFTVFQNPTYGTSTTSFMTTKEKAAEAKAAKQAAAAKEKKDAEDMAAQQARDSTNVSTGLYNLNKSHGLTDSSGKLTYDPFKAGRRRRPTRRSRKTKSKRRKTRRRR